LIVVIVIIAVLAEIITTNLVKYTRDSEVAAMKGQMSQLTVAATDYYSNNGTYSGFCNSQIARNILDNIDDATGGAGCADPGGIYRNASFPYAISATTNNGWIACANYPYLPVAPIPGWCVDYNGTKKLVSSAQQRPYCLMAISYGYCP
jgi:type II secretory pathway pseudopilin PulG